VGLAAVTTPSPATQRANPNVAATIVVVKIRVFIMKSNPLDRKGESILERVEPCISASLLSWYPKSL
jgi:hypothetical protein